MALNTDIIKKRLAAAPWKQKDNEAQSIIKEAKPAELKALDVEGVLRLYEALAMLPPRVYSGNDKAAMRKLKVHTRFQPIVRTPHFGVDLIKKARPGSPIIQSRLTPKLVTRIYVAEKKRLSLGERIAEFIRYDNDRIGRGQLGKDAYTDVKQRFKTTLETCLAHVFLSKMLQNAPMRPPMNEVDFRAYKVMIPASHRATLSYPPAEDFVVAAYLAIRIEDAAKRAGRSTLDITRFVVALYHAGRSTISDIQAKVGDIINWAPVETELLERGLKDIVDYVNEVVK